MSLKGSTLLSWLAIWLIVAVQHSAPCYFLQKLSISLKGLHSPIVVVMNTCDSKCNTMPLCTNRCYFTLLSYTNTYHRIFLCTVTGLVRSKIGNLPASLTLAKELTLCWLTLFTALDTDASFSSKVIGAIWVAILRRSMILGQLWLETIHFICVWADASWKIKSRREWRQFVHSCNASVCTWERRDGFFSTNKYIKARRTDVALLIRTSVAWQKRMKYS